jgi:hypothetical protein
MRELRCWLRRRHRWMPVPGGGGGEQGMRWWACERWAARKVA